MISVLFAIETLDHGGPDRVFFELLRALPRSKFTLSLAIRHPEGRYFGLLPDDVSVEVLGDQRYPVLPLLKAVRRRKPDLIFTTLNMNLTAAAARFLFPHGTRHIARVANHLSSNFQELFRQSIIKHRLAYWLSILALKWADEVVCQSQTMADDLMKLTGRKTPYPIIGNPIDIPSVQGLSKKTVSLPGDPPLLAVGRLASQKGFDILIKAMPEVLRHQPKAVLTIIGEGEMRADLESLVSQLHLSSSVRLPGSSQAIYAHMRSAKLLVSSSRYEGFSNVILEAMACMTPVVATDCPGATRDLVRNGETGWLAMPEDSRSLATCILNALAADLSAAATNALSMVSTRYSPQVIAGNYERVFLTVARRSLNSGPPSLDER